MYKECTSNLLAVNSSNSRSHTNSSGITTYISRVGDNPAGRKSGSKINWLVVVREKLLLNSGSVGLF